MLPLTSLSLTPDYGDELWALPALDSESVSPPIRDAYNDYEAGHMPHQGEDVELNEYWSGGLSASQSCSAGSPQTKYRLVIRESANAATEPHLRNSSRVCWERYGAELYLGVRCGQEGLAGTVQGSLLLAPVE